MDFVFTFARFLDMCRTSFLSFLGIGSFFFQPIRNVIGANIYDTLGIVTPGLWLLENVLGPIHNFFGIEKAFLDFSFFELMTSSVGLVTIIVVGFVRWILDILP